MQKRVILAVLLVLALSLSLVNAQDDPLAGVDPTGVVVEYWHEWNGAQNEGITEVIRLFEEQNEFGITVEVQELGGGSAIVESVSAGITSGELPNIAGNGFVNNAQSWAVEDVLVPLDVYINHPEYGLTEDELAALSADALAINSPTIEDSIFQGELLAWPTGISANVLGVNIDMINEMNDLGAIDFRDRGPETLEEFTAVACAGADLENLRGEGPDINGYPVRLSFDDMASFIYNQGGTIFNDEDNAYDFTNDTVIEILTYFDQLVADGCAYLPEERFPDSGIMALGLTPMAMGSTAGLPFIQSAIEESGSGIENWTQTTVPATEGNEGLLPFLRGVTVMESTPEENLAAWLFIKFWATNLEAQVAWTEGASYQPLYAPVPEALSEDFLAAVPQFGDLAAVVFDEDTSLINLPVHPRNRDIGDVFVALVTEVLTSDVDIAEAAADAEEEANEIYEDDLANFE